MNDDPDDVIDTATVMQALDHMSQTVSIMNKIVTRLRNHMQWEEQDLFTRIDKMLDAQPHKVDISEYEHIKDPVFELEIEAGFRRMIASLR